jgi:diguanylate cyclase
MLEANRQLQARLDTAEAALQEQSSDIAAYISQARTDALTSVSNRRVFDETLAAALAAWNAQGKPVCVMLFDIDHFKLLNDTRGHLAGDAVLRDLAQLLRESAPAGAMIARYGGEEFACISMAGDVHHAAELADYFRQVVESNLFLYEREAIRVTMSCGVAQAVYREDALSLLKRCDSALYSAKSVGRNVVYWHDGYHCVAYQSQDAMPVPQTDPANRVVEDFQDLCKDLRNKLAQISVRNEVHATLNP